MLIGIICVAGTAIILGIMPTIQKQALLNGLPLNSLLLLTNLTFVLVCLVLMLIRKRSFRITIKQLLQSALIGIFGLFLSAMLLNASYLYLPVGTAIMLNFLYPAIVCAIMGIIFKEGFSKFQVMAIIASILGMIFLTGNGGKMPAVGVAMAITSAFTYAIYLVANEKGEANKLPLEVKLFYASLSASAAFALITFVTGTFSLPVTATEWLMVVGGSGMFTSCGCFLMVYGISKLGASTASFVSMLEPIVSVIFGTIWFRDPITIGIIAGGCLILTGILLITIDGYRKS